MAAATAGLIDSRLGPWNKDGQRRESDPLPPPFHESIAGVGDDDLLVNRLRMPLACMIDARKVECLQHEVAELWAPLWDAHRRGLARWWKEGYDHYAHITHEPIAHRMIEVALDGDRDAIGAHIETLAADSNSARLLFDGFATVFTYDEDLRLRMADFWPWALKTALDAIGDGTPCDPNVTGLTTWQRPCSLPQPKIGGPGHRQHAGQMPRGLDSTGQPWPPSRPLAAYRSRRSRGRRRCRQVRQKRHP